MHTRKPSEGQGRRKDIDGALDELLAIAAPGVPMSQSDIARYLEIKQSTVAQYERRALIKIRRAFGSVLRELVA